MSTLDPSDRNTPFLSDILQYLASAVSNESNEWSDSEPDCGFFIKSQKLVIMKVGTKILGHLGSVNTLPDEENFAYIPLSSLIILLVILLTCASRRKKIDAYSAVEQNFENNIKEEYAIMCFPCLKKKPDLKEFEPTEDLSNQFEYIVEKYTIRKVPLLLANTVEDIIERQEQLEAKTPLSQPQLIKDEFVNFQVSQEVYNVQRMPPCITIAANTGCPGKKAIKERLKPSDVLESMSPVSRSPTKDHNYVVIPTKGSLRHKDIMMTKREITNQYLNNFSSVFVDNIKEQVPKDPERFPSLSRPYTGAFKNFPVEENAMHKSTGRKKCRRGKTQNVAYAFPSDETETKEENSVKEDPYSDTDSTQEQTTDALESEFQEDVENETAEFTGKSKSLVLLNDSDSVVDGTESLPNPFKTTIKSSMSEIENNPPPKNQTTYISTYVPNKDEWPNTKNVTYEDIQALDVGYEFTSCEKLGVKPKMTRIHCPLETEKFKESLKLTFGDSSKTNKRSYSQDQSLAMKAIKTIIIKPPTVQPARLNEEPATHYGKELILPLSEKTSSKSVLTETSFLPYKETIAEAMETAETLEEPPLHDLVSTSFVKGEESKSHSFNDQVLNDAPSAMVVDSVTEISKLYDLSMPVTHRRESPIISELIEANQPRPPVASKSRSFQEATGTRNEGATEVKGKVYLPYPIPNSTKKDISRLDEPETETTCSLYSRESKTSSAVTTAMSSEVDEGKRATLRWKIIIKHHREDDSSRKNVNVNIKH